MRNRNFSVGNKKRMYIYSYIKWNTLFCIYTHIYICMKFIMIQFCDMLSLLLLLLLHTFFSFIYFLFLSAICICVSVSESMCACMCVYVFAKCSKKADSNGNNDEFRNAKPTCWLSSLIYPAHFQSTFDVCCLYMAHQCILNYYYHYSYK